MDTHLWDEGRKHENCDLPFRIVPSGQTNLAFPWNGQISSPIFFWLMDRHGKQIDYNTCNID
jgi:hypothetical protein